jgi:hypothetical protein
MRVLTYDKAISAPMANPAASNHSSVGSGDHMFMPYPRTT